MVSYNRKYDNEEHDNNMFDTETFDLDTPALLELVSDAGWTVSQGGRHGPSSTYKEGVAFKGDTLYTQLCRALAHDADYTGPFPWDD